MEDVLLKSNTTQAGRQQRHVHFYIDGQDLDCAGSWQWDLQSEAVFCSDVMLQLATPFDGTFGLLHPDDKTQVRDALRHVGDELVTDFQFRIITTYGQVVVLSGSQLFLVGTSAVEAIQPEPDLQRFESRAASRHLALQLRASEVSARLTGLGHWYYNAGTGETFYSDEVFRIYGLPRQSLNPHLNTFSQFIHPDDRDTVMETTARGLQRRIPIHLDYRILTPVNVQKRIRQLTQWEFTDWGSAVLYATVQDISEEAALEQTAVATRASAQLGEKLLHLAEQNAQLGYWSLNLRTRKLNFSDGFYRLHGLRPSANNSSRSHFMNLVHPEDLDAVEAAYNKILLQQAAPDLEYRTLRPDGTIHHLCQRGRLAQLADDPVMLVTVQDITVDVLVRQKLAVLKRDAVLHELTQQQAEQLAQLGSWRWDAEADNLEASTGLNHLLGLRPADGQLTQKQLLKLIHTEDRKRFSEAVQRVLEDRQHQQLEFRFLRQGEVHYGRAHLHARTILDGVICAGILQDITAQTTLQLQLNEQAAQTNTITENMIDRLVITDLQNTVVRWNRASEQAYGLKKEAVIGRNIFDVLPALKNDEDLDFFNRALQGESITIPHAKATLRQEVHDLHLIPLRDSTATVIGVLHLLHDVTREHDMNRRLNERLNFIESLVEASPDRILVVDRHMNYLYCNQRAAEFYGMQPEDLLGKNVLEIFPAATNDPSHEHFRRALRGENVHLPLVQRVETDTCYEVFLVPIFSEARTVSAVLWLQHDLPQ